MYVHLTAQPIGIKSFFALLSDFWYETALVALFNFFISDYYLKIYKSKVGMTSL